MSLPVPQFEREKTISLFTVIFYLLLIVLGLWLVYALRDLIPPFVIAIVISLTLGPEIDRMERRGWKRGWAILVIYLLFIAAFVALLILAIPFVSSQLGDIAQKLISRSSALQFDFGSGSHMTQFVSAFLKKHNVPDIVSAPVIGQVKKVPDVLSNYLTSLSQNLPIIAGNLLWIILIPILSFYFLADYHTIIGKTMLFVRPEKRLDMLRVMNDVVAVFGNYLRGVVIMVLLDIAVTYAILRIFHVQYAETVAVLAGILYAIPYLGAVISTLLIGLVALQGGTVAKAIVVLAVMVFIHQFLFDQIVAPRIIGKQVGLHPLLAITAMLAGGTLFGVEGTLFAIPLAAGIQVVMVHLYPRLTDDTVAQLSEHLAQQSSKMAESEQETGQPHTTRPPRIRRKRGTGKAEIAPVQATDAKDGK